MTTRTHDLDLDDGHDSELEGFRLDVTVNGKKTTHASTVNPSEIETWKNVKQLGRGGYGTVSLERCTSSPGTERLRAVKRVSKPPGSQSRLYLRELKAMARLVRPRVRPQQIYVNLRD